MKPRADRIPFADTAYDVVAITASAGGIEALGRVLGGLRADFPAAVVVVQHIPPQRTSSVAACCKERAIAVVLTGGGSNGAAGVRLVKELGGFVIAQDEATSYQFAMPRAAIATKCVDLVLPLSEIAPELVRLVKAGDGALVAAKGIA
jgi:chemotaxis response regulator CheB